MAKFRVSIELDYFETVVAAKNKTEARKKALAKLKKKNPVNLITKDWNSGRKNIDLEEG